MRSAIQEGMEFGSGGMGSESDPERILDPICGMALRPWEIFRRWEGEGSLWGFCCAECWEAFRYRRRSECVSAQA